MISSNGVFVYTVISNKIRIGNITNTTNYHNGVNSSVVSSLTECQIPSSINGMIVDSIGYRALTLLPNLKQIYVPKTITMTYGDAFAFNSNLENVIFEEGSQLKDLSIYAFCDCKSMKIVILPKSIISLSRKTFGRMDSLEHLYIQNFVSCDDIDVFNTTNIEKLKIYVPSNYPKDTFGTVPVQKILAPYYKQTFFTSSEKKINLSHIIILLLSKIQSH